MPDETLVSDPAPKGNVADHPLIFASRVDGTPVFDSAGEKIGHVLDISIEKVSGKAVYGILSFGGFLGIGEKYHPLPWSILTYEPEKGGFVVPLDKKALEAAPYYDRSELDKLGGEHRSFNESIYSYYGRYGALPYY